MRKLLSVAINFIEMLRIPPVHSDLSVKKLSNRSIKIMIWSRIVLRLMMWLVALYLIAKFALFTHNLFFN
jgi:hypothetical protein